MSVGEADRAETQAVSQSVEGGGKADPSHTQRLFLIQCWCLSQSVRVNINQHLCCNIDQYLCRLLSVFEEADQVILRGFATAIQSVLNTNRVLVSHPDSVI